MKSHPVHIVDFWRKRMKGFAPLPPPDIWGNIENALDIEETWDRIEIHLELEEVWQNMEHSLEEKRGRKRFLVPLLAAASVALLLGIFVLMPNKTPQQDLVTDQWSLSPEKEPASSPASLDQLASGEPTNPRTALTETNRSYPAEAGRARELSLTILPAEDKSAGRPSSAMIAQAIVPGKEYYQLETPATDLEIDRMTSPELHQTSGSATRQVREPGKWNMGFSAQVKNHWLLNPTTFNGLKSTNLTTTIPELGMSVQVSLGRAISPKWGVRFESELFDKGGQGYRQYIHGQYLKKTIDLNFISMQALFLRKNIQSQPGLFSGGTLLFGFYGSYLYHAEEKIENHSSLDLTNTYNSFDYGLILGYEQAIRVTPRLDFSPGFRVHYGIPNIYSGSTTVPAYLLRTNRASFRLQFGLNYKF